MDRVDRFRRLVAGLRDSNRLVGATCTQIGPELWFPPQAHHHRDEALARELCRECPVRRECLRIALEAPDRITAYGVWAGYTAVKIRRMRRLMRVLGRAPKEEIDAAA